MILETSRLILRDFEYTDIAELAPILADPWVMAYSSHGAAFTWQQTDELIKLYILESAQHDLGVLAIIRKEDHAFIGYCGLEWHNIKEKTTPELVYCLGRGFWGMGFAEEAARAVKTYAMDVCKISPLASFIRPENTRSIHLAEKLGAKFQDRIRIHNVEKCVYVY
jgi:[ribosomal protein S5]-alanine N-acetyltransferase